jgi:hypothetical protein
LGAGDDPGDVGILCWFLVGLRLPFFRTLRAALGLGSLALLLLRLAQALVDRGSSVCHGVIFYSPGALVNRPDRDASG